MAAIALSTEPRDEPLGKVARSIRSRHNREAEEPEFDEGVKTPLSVVGVVGCHCDSIRMVLVMDGRLEMDVCLVR